MPFSVRRFDTEDLQTSCEDIVRLASRAARRDSPDSPLRKLRARSIPFAASRFSALGVGVILIFARILRNRMRKGHWRVARADGRAVQHSPAGDAGLPNDHACGSPRSVVTPAIVSASVTASIIRGSAAVVARISVVSAAVVSVTVITVTVIAVTVVARAVIGPPVVTGTHIGSPAPIHNRDSPTASKQCADAENGNS